MPAKYNSDYPAWREHKLMSYVPPALLPAEGQYDARVTAPMLQGGARGGKLVTTDKVPWDQWKEPLATWLPLVVLMGLAVICLGLIVHPQWSFRERLRYPVAQFASSLLAQDQGRFAPILRNRMFWIGLAVVLAVRVVNGLHAWQVLNLEIPLYLDLRMLAPQLPSIANSVGGDRVLLPEFYPAVIAFSFFLASDVALSLGISQIAFVLVMGVLLRQGVGIDTDYLTGGPSAWQYFGSYLGVGLLLAYTGRRYYLSVLKEALTFRRSDGVERYAVWACRLLLVFSGGAAAVMVGMGLPAGLAVIMVLLLLLMFSVMARVNVESGLIFCQPYWQPLTVFIGLFGLGALGPQVFIILALVCAVLTIDPRESLMPFVVNGLRIGQDAKVQPGRVGPLAAVALVVALVVAVPVVLGATYQNGAPEHDGWAYRMVPEMPFKALLGTVTKLEASGQLEHSLALSGLERFTSMKPDASFVTFALIGLGLAVGMNFLRLRFTWWPLHPILFLVWGTYSVGFFATSFLLGWMIKSAVTKFGGTGAYAKAKTLMIGVIAGDLLGGLIFMAAGAIYYAVTHTVPPIYRIFPG